MDLSTLAKMVADEFTSKGVEFKVDRDSPLYPAVSAVVMRNSEQMLVDPNARVTELDEEGAQQALSEVDPLIEEVSENLSKVMRLRRSIMVNTVIPETKAFTNAVVDAYDKYITEHKRNITNVKVVNIDIPPLVLELDASGKLPNQPDRIMPKFSTNYRVSFKPIEVGMLRQSLKQNTMFGMAREAWWEYVDGISDNDLSTTYETYFSTISSGSYPWTNINKFKITDLDKALLIFVLCNLFTMDIPEGATAASGTYKPAMRVASNYMLTIIDALVQRYAAAVRNDTVVSSYDWDNNIIYVYTPSFTKYLDNGGVAEALYGAVITRSMVYSISNIKSASERLVKGWSKYVALKSLQAKTANPVEVGMVIRTVFNKHLDEISDAEKELLSSLGLTVDSVKKEASELLQRPTVNEDNLEMFCMELLCNTRWKGADFDTTLLRFNSLISENKELDTQEAVGVAIFGDVISYLIPRHISA